MSLHAKVSRNFATRLEIIPMFQKLSADQRERLISYAVLRRFPKNQMVMSMGEQANSIYIILSGRVKIIRDDEGGREVIVSLLGPGEFFGEMSLLDDSPRSANVVAMEACEMVVFTKADFLLCMKENFEICFYIMQTLAKRLRAATEKIETLALMDVYGRVARLLLDMAVERDGELVILQKISKQDIGRMVGASREMVSRVMKDLVDRDQIRLIEGGMMIPNRLDASY